MRDDVPFHDAKNSGEQEVQESLLALILDVIPYVVFWKDRRSSYLGVNRNFATLAGFSSPAELVGLTDYDMPWTREESDAYRADDREVMETGKPKLHIVETQLNAAGERTWLDTSKVPLRNAAGEVIGVLGIYADITDLKNAEESLQKTRQHLEDAIEAIDAGIVMYDAEERFVFCNERYRQIYREVRDFMVPGRSYADLLRRYVELNPEAIGGEAPDVWVQERLEHHRRCHRWEQNLGDRVIQISDRRTRDHGVVSLRSDITADKIRERELQRAKEAAVAANAAKSSFLANLSHEIRTPMSAILGFTDVLLSSSPRPDQCDALGTIQRNAGHLLDVINDILDLSKIEVGKLRVESETVDLMELLSEVHALMGVRAEGKGLSLRMRFDGVVPRAIETDATRFRQVLVNLLGNAIKFTDAGAVSIVVETPISAVGDRELSICVEDQGIGIASEHLERIFDAFEQADVSTTRRFGGTGLGLAISLRLARLLGGDVTVESALGEGSRFTLRHPIPKNAEWVEPVRVERSAQASVRDTDVGHLLTGRRVLLVEDGHDNQRLFSHYLHSMGAKVEVAVDGQEAVDRQLEIVGGGFDLVLMDMQMPRLDGYTATQQLRAAGCVTPIIALTAHAMAGDRERCLGAGCDDYLSKPLRRSTMAEAVVRWVGRTAADQRGR
ncbi:MAG: response regulator [Planctomycetes bacterium]|nr:response regulator [Planctomycetota bacterium]